MDFLNQTRFIERLQFFNGQRLFANDLQGLEAFNREMRWLHNKSLHQPGIGNGFAVAGKKGDREVTIRPGYAIDAEGREIVLMQNQVEPVPPVTGEDDGSPALFDLTVSYPNDADLEETERRDGICRQPGGTVRLKEEPVFCWVRLDENGQPKEAKQKQEILTGMRIVLARAEVLNCQLHKDISIAQRLNARPARQPYVCCGTTAPDWQPWMIAKFEPARILATEEGKQLFATALNSLRVSPLIAPIGLQAEINTSQCGFQTTPCYSARIVGPRIKQIRRETNGTENGDSVTSTYLVDGLVQIVEPLPEKFTVQVLLIVQELLPVTVGRTRANATRLEAARLEAASKEEELQQFVAKYFSDWQLVWMGVEG